jgi:type IV pilus assembly protein PilC
MRKDSQLAWSFEEISSFELASELEVSGLEFHYEIEGIGVPIIRSLEIVSETSGNELVNRVVRNAMQCTEKGEPIATALRASKFIPRMVAKMVEIGETTGRLEQMLQRIGAFYTEQVNTAVAGLTALIEPLMIVFLGVVIGGIMLSMFMPIFQLSQVVS